MRLCFLRSQVHIYTYRRRVSSTFTKGINFKEASGQESRSARLLCCTIRKDCDPSTVSTRNDEILRIISQNGQIVSYRTLFSQKLDPISVILVKKGGKVWVLDRSVFLTIMMRTAQEQLESNIRFLQRVSVLQKLPEPKDHVLAKISDLLRIVRIIQQRTYSRSIKDL